MLVLVSSGLPALPDSICLPEEMLVSFAVGQPSVWQSSVSFGIKTSCCCKMTSHSRESFPSGKVFPAFLRWRR